MRLLPILFVLFTAHGLAYDLILKNGHLIDPKNGLNGRFDVAVSNGRIAAVAPVIDLAGTDPANVLDVSGLYVTPGLVDIHTHVFFTGGVPGAWAGDNSVQPDAFSFRHGVTTMVDAGSSGWRNFEIFRTQVIDRARTRVLAMINIAGFGMISDATEQGDFDPAAIARLAARHKDVVVGVKSAHYQQPDWDSVELAIEAGKKAGIPVMVDFGYFLPDRPFWKLVHEKLRPGDIATHAYRGPVPWVDSNGKLFDYLKQSRERGVIFDVGHGGGSFTFRNAAPSIAQGFYPDTISTDLHSGSMNAGMQDMPATMSKFLAMGMPLDAVVRASTWRAAQVIHRERDLGHLSVGSLADVAVWKLHEGEFGFGDAYGARYEGKQRLECELTFKDGGIVWNLNARGGKDYRKLPANYGIRPKVDQIVPPPARR